jgi:hypothetical protein
MKLSTTAAELLGASLIGGAICAPSAKCLCLPGDACWPAQQAWSQLNSTVNGNLVATVPIGSPCHDPTFDATACDALQKEWLNPLTQ